MTRVEGDAFLQPLWTTPRTLCVFENVAVGGASQTRLRIVMLGGWASYRLAVDHQYPTVWNVQSSEGRGEQEPQRTNHIEPVSRREYGLHLHTLKRQT